MSFFVMKCNKKEKSIITKTSVEATCLSTDEAGFLIIIELYSFYTIHQHQWTNNLFVPE